jgi:hypothetical protein
MIFVLTLSALVFATAAFVMVSRLERRVRDLSEMYWQLRYEHGELKAAVTPAEPPAPAVQQTFVPLAQIKRAAPPS